MAENLSVFVNRRKKLTTQEELEQCTKEVIVQINWPTQSYCYPCKLFCIFVGANQSSAAIGKPQSTAQKCIEKRNGNW